MGAFVAVFVGAFVGFLVVGALVVGVVVGTPLHADNPTASVEEALPTGHLTHLALGSLPKSLSHQKPIEQPVESQFAQ